MVTEPASPGRGRKPFIESKLSSFYYPASTGLEEGPFLPHEMECQSVRMMLVDEHTSCFILCCVKGIASMCCTLHLLWALRACRTSWVLLYVT